MSFALEMLWHEPSEIAASTALGTAAPELRAGALPAVPPATESLVSRLRANLAGGPRAERQILIEVTEALRGILEHCRMPAWVREDLARAEALAGTAVAVLDAVQSSSAVLLRDVVRRT